jgi:hypothetical protein
LENIMKMTKIALALACLVGSTSASAITIAQIEAARVNGTLQQAWITGASAPTISVYEGWVGAGTGVGCDPGTNTIYTSQGNAAPNTGLVKPGSIGNFMAYACLRAGVPSVLYHTLDGGSLNAYTPHTIGTRLARLAYLGNTTCSVTGLTYTDSSNTTNNATVNKGCTLTGSALPPTGATGATNTANATAVAGNPRGPQLPVGGFSDVEAGLFPASIGGGNVSTVGTESDANIGQAFGVVASIPLYRAMQANQGVTPAQIAADTTFDPALAPSISKAQYTSIITGTYQTDWAPITGATGAGKRVILHRRIATSGTQASSNAFFLANPCSAGLSASLNPSVAADTTPSFLVVENSSTGNVKTGISNASLNTGAENFAIGVMSVENDWRLEPSTATSGYRFLKVDGVHPETGDIANGRLTSVNGLYGFHMELKNFVANTATGFGAAIIPQITAALAAPQAASCSVFPRGLTLNPAGGSVCTTGVQVMRGTNGGNNCAPQQLF